MGGDEEMSDGVMAIQKPTISFEFREPLHMWSLAPEFKLIFIIRNGGEERTMCPTNIRNILRSMRLQKMNSGVFFKADEPLMAILRKLKDFVTYKYPTDEDAKKLICNLAAVRLEKKVILLKRGDHVVDQAFGRYNIHCLEDVANEVVNVGPHFKEVSTIIRPFLFLHQRPTNLTKGQEGKEKGSVTHLIGKLKIT